MSSFVTAVAVFVGTGGAIAAALEYGTRYIDRKLLLPRPQFPSDRPIIRSHYPSGEDWLAPPR